MSSDLFDGIDGELESIFGASSDEHAEKPAPAPKPKQERVGLAVASLPTNEIIYEYARTLVPGIEIDAKGLVLPSDWQWQPVQELFDELMGLEASHRLWIGDLLNEVERRDREGMSQLLSDYTGNKLRTIENWRYTARNVPRALRPDPKVVPYSKLYEVASLKSDLAQELIIGYCYPDNGWLSTQGVQELCKLLKAYDDADTQIGWAAWVDENNLTAAEWAEAMREDQTPVDTDEPEAPKQEVDGLNVALSGSAGDQLAQLAALMIEIVNNHESTGDGDDAHTLFVSMVLLAHRITYSTDIEIVDEAFNGLGAMAEHVAQLRQAVLSGAGACTCSMMGGSIVRDAGCVVHAIF